MFGPRWVDPARLGDVKPATLVVYRQAATAFLQFLDEENYEPGCAEEFDDLLVEWSISRCPKLSQLRLAVAATEFVYPRFKGKLVWSRQRLDSLERESPPQHAVPCGRELAGLLGAQLSSLRHARYGLGLELQAAVGLRPGEMVQLTGDDFRQSPEVDKAWLVIIRLGHAVSTKVRREQYALLDVRTHSSLWKSLQLAIRLTPDGAKVFPFSLASYSHWLKQAQLSLNLPLGISPHSGRAGFVSDAIAQGKSPTRIREAGRWASESSFRIYVDIVGSLHAGQAARIAGYADAIQWVLGHAELYYTEVSLDVYRLGAHGSATHRDAAADQAQGEGEVPPTGRGRGRRSGGAAPGRGAGRGRGRDGAALVQ